MTLTSDVVGQFAELFQGRYDAYGEEHGGCRRLQGDIGPRSHEGFMDAHLQGARPIGVYPMVLMEHKGVAKPTHTEWHPEWYVHWGCIDFDEGEEESWLHAKNVHLALQTFGIVGWIERSRSKGYHVWVFADDWASAGLMRKALLAACQIVDAPTKEINPKQEKLNAGQLGNYVRLPYPGWLKGDGAIPVRRVVLNPSNGVPITLQNFVSRAYSSRVGRAGLESLAAAYREPERPIQRRDWTGLPRTADGIDGFAKWVAKQEEGNRNMGLYWAACECLDQGIEDLDDLIEAGIMSGLSEVEARRTVESAQRH